VKRAANPKPKKPILNLNKQDSISAPKTLIVVTGPTAVGKTALAIELAELFSTEILSADSRQFYREMTIGTAKPTAAEQKQVIHHFIDFLPVTESYTAGQFSHDATALTERLFESLDVLILAGGSGLYVDAVCRGFDELPPADEAVRNQLKTVLQEEGLAGLQKRLLTTDPVYYRKVDLGNPQRLMRALEIGLSTGMPYSTFLKGRSNPRPWRIIKIGLNLDREELYQRINQRVDRMMEEGLLKEAGHLLPYRHLNALQTVGYKELFEYLDKKTSLGKAVELIKQHSRNFAKRQLTWFKKDPDITWFEPGDTQKVADFIKNVMRSIQEFK